MLGYLIFAFLMFILGIPGFLIKRRADKLANQLEVSGVQGEATVAKMNMYLGVRRDFYAAWLEHEVTAEDGRTTTYRRRILIHQRTYDALEVGQRVPIRYWRDKPKVMQLAGEYSDNFSSNNALYLGAVCWAVAAALVVLGLRELRLPTPMSYPESTPYSNEATEPGGYSFALIQMALELQITTWKNNTHDQAVHYVDRTQIAQIGLGVSNMGGVTYGYCADGTFYLLTPASSGQVYFYSTNANDQCWSEYVSMSGTVVESMGGGWSLMKVTTVEATPTPRQ